ncbi:MAG: aldo/keto reductase [Bdellovibrionales bacterium]|nr:aldo/keto reductase [Bdellovibrionales bacterium]
MSDLSRIGFGGAALSGEGRGYGFGEISEQESMELLHEAAQLGFKLVDLAPIYGFGLAEQKVGRALRQGLRDKIRVVSKAGVTWDRNKRVDIDYSPQKIQKMLEQSLRDLQVDSIDIYLIHWPDPRHDIRAAYEVLVRAKEEGKVQKIGLSNTYKDDIEKAQEIGPIEVIQGVWNLFDQSAQDHLFPHVRELKTDFMGWGTFDKGVATGRVTPDRQFKDPADARSWAPWWKGEDRTWKFQAMEEIQKIAGEEGVSLVSMALNTALSAPEVTYALVGARNLSQLHGIVEGLRQKPSSDFVERCLQIVRHYKEAFDGSSR